MQGQESYKALLSLSLIKTFLCFSSRQDWGQDEAVSTTFQDALGHTYQWLCIYIWPRVARATDAPYLCTRTTENGYHISEPDIKLRGVRRPFKNRLRCCTIWNCVDCYATSAFLRACAIRSDFKIPSHGIVRQSRLSSETSVRYLR